MTGEFSYREYVGDEAFLADYNDYQQKYALVPRESDKVIMELVGEYVSKRDVGRSVDLLDIGCSTGNLLLHLKRMFPAVVLEGGDLAESSLEICRANAALAGIKFTEMDIMTLPKQRYDLIVVNAVFYMFDEKQYEDSLTSVAASLRPGGSAIIYDFAHVFGQDIEILEKTSSHPDGLRICFRPMSKISACASRAGFSSVDFRPFELPIDLPRSPNNNEIITYTRISEDRERMAFRGTLYQPWCHMIAHKA
jgi:SAM-dependent methyltransferase